MTAKEYVENCTQFVEDFFVDPDGNVVDIVEERKLDTSTMRYYTTHYLINGFRYAINEEIRKEMNSNG